MNSQQKKTAEWFREMDEADERKARAQRQARANQARKEAKRKRKQTGAAQKPKQPAANPKAPVNPRIPFLTVLGLREDQDTAPAIRSAYRRLALRFHPDKNPGGAERFKEILAAYETLIEEV
jgi:hypothetical protein